jgi:monoterpene epsilon-lactone hydrolase
MIARVHFRGPPQYCLRSAAELSQSVLEVSARRMLKGPRQPGWNWLVEVATHLLKKQVNTALSMRGVEEARRYLDSVVISSAVLSEVNVRQVVHDKFRGSWFSGKTAEPRRTVLYFHGGGYSFYPRAYASFIAQITLAAKSRTFPLDYRLSPEHRFPAQLEDALNAYRWLLENGTNPDTLVFTGDSAGGNLTLALLLQVRDVKLPLPAAAIVLSPPTNFESESSATMSLTGSISQRSCSGGTGFVTRHSAGTRWFPRCGPICGAFLLFIYRPVAPKFCTRVFKPSPITGRIRERMLSSKPGRT